MAEAAVAAAAGSAPAKTSFQVSRLVALLLALAFVVACRFVLGTYFSLPAGDFDHLYASAARLLRGENPYLPDSQGIPYPLPAVVLLIPFSMIPLDLARVIFDVLVGWIFAWALWRYRGSHALLALGSGAYVYALVQGQITPLLVAAVLVPVLGSLLAVRPNTSLALLAARPSWIALIGMAGFLGLTVALVPSWPTDWWRALPVEIPGWGIPLLRPFGAILLLGALRWNRPEGRLLLATAFLPQTTLPYELVPLALIPTNGLEMVIYMVGSWITVAATTGGLKLPGGAEWLSGGWPVMLLAGYLPMLLLVLRRPGSKGGPWIGPERRRPHRIPDAEVEVVATADEPTHVSVTVIHRPSGQSMTQSAPTKERAVRKAHDRLAALLSQTFRLARKDPADPK